MITAGGVPEGMPVMETPARRAGEIMTADRMVG
jgi:hypothetical protein